MKHILVTLFFVGMTWPLLAQPVISQQSHFQPQQINDWLETPETIYIATDVGIYLLDRQTGAIADHWTRATANLPSNRVEAIAIHPSTETMYIGTYDIGVGRITTDGDWEPMPYPQDWPNSFNPNLTYCLGFDKSERLLVGTNQGLLRWEGEEWTIFDNSDFQPFFQAVWDMERQDNGELLMAGNLLLQTSGDSINIINPLDTFGQVTLFSYGDSHIHIKSNGDVFLITDLGEVGRFDGQEWEVWSVIQGTSELSLHNSAFIYEDEEASLWVYQHHQEYAKFADGEWTFPGESPVNVSHPKGIWNANGITYSISNDTLFQFSDELLSVDKLGNLPWEGGLFRFKSDRNGELWSRGNWAELINLDDGSIHTLTIDGEEVFIYDFVFDQNNNLWVSSGSQMHYFNENLELIATYSSVNSNLPPQQSFRHLACDRSDQVWVNTYDYGLFVFNGSEWNAVNEPNGNILGIQAAEAEDGVYLNVYDNGPQIKLYHQVGNDYAQIFQPSSWSNSGFASLAVDTRTGRLWLANTDVELAIHTGEGSWDLLPGPVEWDASDYIRKISVHEQGVWILGQHQLAFRENDGNWYYYNQNTLPLDRDRMYDAGLAKNGSLWITHNTNRIIEELVTTWETVVTDVADLEQITNGQVFPNPAAEWVYPQWEEAGEVFLFNAAGQLIIQRSVLDPRDGLNVSNIPAGQYWLVWKTDEGRSVVASFVKQ